MKKLFLILLAGVFFAFAACSGKSGTDADKNTAAPAGSSEAPTDNEGDKYMNKVYATITMESGGVMRLELYPDLAPQSVRNFCYLARKGFYDGLTFHRIIPGFMVQGGDPEGTGSGGPGYNIKGEFLANGFENDLSHTRGVISWARRSNPYMDSAGSQFFIMHADYPGLDGQYAAFGRVIEGIEVVDQIASVQTGANNRPVTPVVIKTITIEGDELPAPEMLKNGQ